MATNYWFKGTNAETTCDAGGGAVNRDLGDAGQSSPSDSAGTTTSATVNDTPFVEVLVFDMDVSAHSPATGTFDISVSVNAISSGATGRFRAQVIDDAGCSVSQNSSYSSTFTTTGTKTLTTGSLTWGAGDERLRVSIELSRDSGQHGNKSVTVDHNDTNSKIVANGWTYVPPAPLPAVVEWGYEPVVTSGLISAPTYAHSLLRDLKIVTPIFANTGESWMSFDVEGGSFRVPTSFDDGSGGSTIGVPGLGWQFGGGHAGVQYGSNTGQTGSGARTDLVVCEFDTKSNGASLTMVSMGAGTTSNKWDIRISDTGETEGSGHFEISIHGTHAIYDPELDINTPYAFVTRYESGALLETTEVWANGQELTEIGTESGTPNTSTTDYRIGADPNGNGDMSGKVYLHMHWTRALDDGEIEILNRDPFILFRSALVPEKIPILVSVVAAPRRIFVVS